MTETQQAWLTQDAYERLKEELLTLVRQRAGDADQDGSGDQALGGRRERVQRIRKLQEILQDPIVGKKPPDDGIAEPGMVLTVSYADGGDQETFLLAEREEYAYPDVEICSPDSPLGRALAAAKEGEERQYDMPNGQAMTVTLVRAVPYGSHRCATPRAAG